MSSSRAKGLNRTCRLTRAQGTLPTLSCSKLFSSLVDSNGYSRLYRGQALLCTWSTGMTSGWCLVALFQWADCGRSLPWCSRQSLSCALVYRPYTQTGTLEICARAAQLVARGPRVARYSVLRGPQRHLKYDVISPFPWQTMKKFWKFNHLFIYVGKHYGIK